MLCVCDSDNEIIQDLWMLSFITCLYLCDTLQVQMDPNYNGPCLGPKQSAENRREFTQEQLDAGKHIHSLQMGSNKGATQAGQNFGAPRQIIN